MCIEALTAFCAVIEFVEYGVDNNFERGESVVETLPPGGLIAISKKRSADGKLPKFNTTPKTPFETATFER